MPAPRTTTLRQPTTSPRDALTSSALVGLVVPLVLVAGLGFMLWPIVSEMWMAIAEMETVLVDVQP